MSVELTIVLIVAAVAITIALIYRYVDLPFGVPKSTRPQHDRSRHAKPRRVTVTWTSTDRLADLVALTARTGKNRSSERGIAPHEDPRTRKDV